MNASPAVWIRRNLFAKPFDAALTLVVVPLLGWILWSILHWAFAMADWSVVRDSLKVLMTGLFPAQELWRAWIATGLIAALLGLACGDGFPMTRMRAIAIPIVVAVASVLAGSLSSAIWIATTGAAFGIAWLVATWSRPLRRVTAPIWLFGLGAVFLVLTPAGVSSWGGLLLSVLITLTAAILILPIGVLLAFGRASRIASLRILCTAYIELMRSVPLILIVYWIWVVLPLLLPQWPIPDVVRGMIGFVVFYSAYAAEFVRSGLQSVPQGQREAAQSLGMSALDVNRIIVLPQALRVAVPGLVGNVLDIFNYAPLVFIIGLTDFLRAGQMILADPANSGNTYEVYVFLFGVYFAIGSVVTFLARRLETHLGKGTQQ